MFNAKCVFLVNPLWIREKSLLPEGVPHSPLRILPTLMVIVRTKWNNLPLHAPEVVVGEAPSMSQKLAVEPQHLQPTHSTARHIPERLQLGDDREKSSRLLRHVTSATEFC